MKQLLLILAAMWNKLKYKIKLKSGMMMIEVMLAMTVVVLVLVALTVATTFSLRNTRYAQNVVLANHYAQEAIEKTRQLRDEATNWDDFINNYSGCKELGSWTNCSLCPNTSAAPNLDIFYRCLTITDDGDSATVTVYVSWDESSRTHTAQAATILSQWE